jgi:hypothetical protein
MFPGNVCYDYLQLDPTYALLLSTACGSDLALLAQSRHKHDRLGH